MKKTLLAAVLLTSALSHLPALANGVETILFSGAVTATTDNRERGISYSDGGLAIKGNVRMDHVSGAYAMMDAASVDFKRIDPDANAQVGFHAGYKNTHDSGIDYDARVSYNVFPGGDNDDMDYWEFALTGGYNFQAFYASATWAISPDYINDSGLTLYYAGDIAVPLNITGHDVSVLGHMGFLFPGDKGKYVDEHVMDYRVGVQYGLPQYDAHINLDYIGTNRKRHECREKCDSRAVLSATKSFGL